MKQLGAAVLAALDLAVDAENEGVVGTGRGGLLIDLPRLGATWRAVRPVHIDREVCGVDPQRPERLFEVTQSGALQLLLRLKGVERPG